MVTSFPFSMTSSPMYDGSTLLFLATALWCGWFSSGQTMGENTAHRKESPAGILITALVYLEYRIALRYEECARWPPPV
jgi:methylene-fatty-acyl-phospholipid synthase